MKQHEKKMKFLHNRLLWRIPVSKIGLSSSSRMERAVDMEECFTDTGFPRKIGNRVLVESVFPANLEVPAFQKKPLL